MREFLILCFSLSFSLLAQDNLSLMQAIQIGLEQNYDIRIAGKRLEKGQNSNTAGEAGLLPGLSLRLNSDNSANINENPAAFLNGTSLSNSISPSLNLNWTIFNGFQAQIKKDKLEALESELQGAVDILIQNTIQNIILAYYITLLERNRSDILRETLEKSKDLYDYSISKKELGTAATADILNDQSAFLTDSINYVKQMFNYRNMIRSLNILLNAEDINQDYIFTDNLTIKAQNLSFETLKEEALNNNSDLKKEYLTLNVFNYNSQLANASRFSYN